MATPLCKLLVGSSVAVGGRVVVVSRGHVVILSLSDGGSKRAAALLLFALRRARLGYEFGNIARLVQTLLPDFGALRA